MGAAPSRRGAWLTSSSLSSTREEFQGTYRRHHKQKGEERDANNHETAGSALKERNINNAHNRYSSTDVGSDYSSATSLFYRRTNTRSSQEIRILRISVGIENKGISVDEGSRSVLKYKTPHFRAKATVEVPELSDLRTVEVGWIQVCHSMQCVNVYGQEGLTSWEFPEIVLGKFEMVSDSDGKRYPWYGTKHEFQAVEGPTDHQTSVTVVMHDNFFPQITWHIPAKGYSREPRLTHIYRRQKFFTFLAVRQLDKETQKGQNGRQNSPIQVLHAVEWSMEVDITVDPTLPLGNRVKSARPRSQEEVTILDSKNNNALLRAYALEPPNANNSQALIWRPYSHSTAHKSSIVVKPLHSTVLMDTYLDRTRDYGYKLVNNWISFNKIDAKS